MKETDTTPSVCPKCGRAYRGHPAVSRADSRTPICPECGTREALESMGLDTPSRTESLPS